VIGPTMQLRAHNQLRWQPLGDSMGIAPKLQGRGRARSSVHVGSVSVLYLFWEMNLRTH